MRLERHPPPQPAEQMIRDLFKLSASHQNVVTDVLVIGAGIAGLLIATRLARAGSSRIMLAKGVKEKIECSDPDRQIQVQTITQLW